MLSDNDNRWFLFLQNNCGLARACLQLQRGGKARACNCKGKEGLAIAEGGLAIRACKNLAGHLIISRI